MEHDELCVALSFVTMATAPAPAPALVTAPATAGGSATMRLFVALELSPEVISRLSAAQDALRSYSNNSSSSYNNSSSSKRKRRNKLRYVEPALLHVTAKFLGEVPRQLLPGTISGFTLKSSALGLGPGPPVYRDLLHVQW